MKDSFHRSIVLGLAAVVLAGCVTTRPRSAVEIVSDLADVAGCRFIAPVGAPQTSLGNRAYAGYENYRAELLRRTAALGATHLYLSNPSAGWGGAVAVGSAYLCTPY